MFYIIGIAILAVVFGIIMLIIKIETLVRNKLGLIPLLNSIEEKEFTKYFSVEQRKKLPIIELDQQNFYNFSVMGSFLIHVTEEEGNFFKPSPHLVKPAKMSQEEFNEITLEMKKHNSREFNKVKNNIKYSGSSFSQDVISNNSPENICSKCGKELKPDSYICWNCGNTVSNNLSSKTFQDKSYDSVKMQSSVNARMAELQEKTRQLNQRNDYIKQGIPVCKKCGLINKPCISGKFWYGQVTSVESKGNYYGPVRSRTTTTSYQILGEGSALICEDCLTKAMKKERDIELYLLLGFLFIFLLDLIFYLFLKEKISQAFSMTAMVISGLIVLIIFILLMGTFTSKEKYKFNKADELAIAASKYEIGRRYTDSSLLKWWTRSSYEALKDK